MPVNMRILSGPKGNFPIPHSGSGEATPHSASSPQNDHSHFGGFGEKDSPAFSGETPAPKPKDDGRERAQAPPP